MIAHGKDIKIFSGNSNRPLAEAICREMGLELGNAEVGAFSDGENFVSIYETVRGSDVFVVQSTCAPVNDSLMEMLIMIDAFKRASAGRITAVMPYFGYARQDRKTKPRDPISAKLVANMIVAAGADRVLTMDLHASQIQGFFDIPVDNLLGNPIFTKYFTERFGDDPDFMVVSPDVGSVARARAFAQKLGMGLAIVDKRRQKANSSEVMNIIGDVTGKKVILFDDMVDTRRIPVRRGPGPGGAGRGHRGLRLRLPRRALRPRRGPHREERHPRGHLPGHRAPPPRREVRQDQVRLRGPHVRRGHRAHLRRGLRVQALRVTPHTRTGAGRRPRPCFV